MAPSGTSKRLFSAVKSRGPSRCRRVRMPNRTGPWTTVSRPLKSTWEAIPGPPSQLYPDDAGGCEASSSQHETDHSYGREPSRGYDQSAGHHGQAPGGDLGMTGASDHPAEH